MFREAFGHLFAVQMGTLQEICEVPNKKYSLAVTKVFGKFMDAIVVNNARVARDCIQFLKEQHKVFCFCSL